METVKFLFGLSLSLVSEAAEKACKKIREWECNPYAKRHVENERDYWEEFKAKETNE